MWTPAESTVVHRAGSIGKGKGWFTGFTTAYCCCNQIFGEQGSGLGGNCPPLPKRKTAPGGAAAPGEIRAVSAEYKVI